MPKGIPLEKSLRMPLDTNCRGCGRDLHLKQVRRTSQRFHWCEECRSHPNIRSFRNVIQKKINIDLEGFTKAYEVSNCQCCGVKLTAGGGPGHSGATNRQIDHCHETGDVRGVICWSCNVGIGKLGDTELGVERALNYLRGTYYEENRM